MNTTTSLICYWPFNNCHASRLQNKAYLPLPNEEFERSNERSNSSFGEHTIVFLTAAFIDVFPTSFVRGGESAIFFCSLRARVGCTRLVEAGRSCWWAWRGARKPVDKCTGRSSSSRVASVVLSTTWASSTGSCGGARKGSTRSGRHATKCSAL